MMHVRVCTDVGRTGRHAGACVGPQGPRGAQRACASARAGVRLDARARGSVRLWVQCSPESTIFTRNEEINLK
ncbi:hypothetical protein CRG98_014847 [Punica granatum]|uniref:Uncharacterized protein n=1 Tax=Punica granatum TaxID=22663 RepID=A0A2I0K8A1_PUNGR|nr:hypothetical protein CRG98_014847 [Punica granatum]